MNSDRALPWYVFGVFVVLTLLATSYVWRSTRAADHARFINAAQAARDAITARLDTYINVLTATRGLMASNPALPRNALRDYIRSHEVQRRYPGIQGIGFTLRVPVDYVETLEAEMRGEGLEDFRVWPDTPRQDIHAVVVLEPIDRRNRAALGYDMSTDPVRRAAMDRARDTGAPAASGYVTLVQEIDQAKQAGFLIYTPVYTTGTVPPTVAERRATLLGFIYAPFRADDLLNGIFASQRRPELGFQITDDGHELFRTQDLPDDARWKSKDAIRVAGRKWEIVWISTRRGQGPAVMLSAATLLGGLIIASLLFSLLRVQLNARAQAEQTAERLAASEAALQRANQAKDDFLATLSHELRTPMTAIMGWAQMLADGMLDAETARTGIQAIGKSSKVQAQLIDDLLDVSRITAGKMRIEHQPLDIAPVVAAAIDTVRPAAEAKRVSVTPRIDTDACVNGDAHRLQQVVWNLLTNAVKFTPEGGTVMVETRVEGREVVIEVRDTGQGIDPEFMPHLFERFRQADSSSTRSHMGLGLGLAIVRHLVELHAGTIAAESRGAGKGATFRVRLPLHEEAPRSRRRHTPVGLAMDLHGVRVLVVDDEEEVRRYVVTALRSAGVDVREAASAKAALDALEEWAADVVISDLAMPHADGFDLLHWIRNASQPRISRVPVVALTAFAMPEDRERVRDAGFAGFLAKPVEPSRLRAAVAKAARSVGTANA
ncbi:MAG TPA: CHASE domain-containing protein [Thermoanaerobaculia bacterium]|nr:CHASE domain-containing protein [Thermoanaerobaculia bacterium]